MPEILTYAYDPQASASLSAQPHAASSAEARAPNEAGGERVVGVFRFRESCPVKVTMAGNRFFAERLRSLNKPDDQTAAALPEPAPRATGGGALSRLQTVLADVLAVVLYRVRSALGRPGGERWELTGRDRAQMEVQACWLDAREERQRLAREKDKALRAAEAALDRELYPATLPSLPDAVLAQISARLPASAPLHQACVVLAQCPDAARAAARGVPTLSDLKRVVRQWLQPPSARSHQPALSVTARAEVAGLLAGRLHALPIPQQSAGACAVLKALDADLIRSGQARVALQRLAQAMQLPGLRHNAMLEGLEDRLLEAIRGMPAAYRVDPCLTLLKHGTESQQQQAAKHLMPSADWVGPEPPVPGSRQREAVQALLAWCGSADRLGSGFETRDAMARFAVELPDQVEVVPASLTEGTVPYSKSTISLKSMVLTELVHNGPHSPWLWTVQWPWEKPDGGGGAAGEPVWDRLFKMASGWSPAHAAPVIAALVGALTLRPEQDRATRLEQVQDCMPRHTPEQRLAIELAAFPLRTPPERVALWPKLWKLWADGGKTRDMATGLRILQAFLHRPDRANWPGELLPRLAALQPAERAALLAGVPVELSRVVKEPILAEEVAYLATMGHPEPMARWIERYRYDEAMLAPMFAAFTRLPPARQAECLLHMGRDTPVPEAMVNAILGAIEQRNVDPATAASLIGALADRFAVCRKDASLSWRVDMGLVARLIDLLPQVDASHDAGLLAGLAHLADAMQIGAEWTVPPLVARIRSAAWQAIGSERTDTHIRRAALDALFPLLVDRDGHQTFSARTYTDALNVATTLPPAERTDMLVKLERLEHGLGVGYGIRRFDADREALWRAIMTLPAHKIARGLALAAPWFLEPSRYGEPRQAEYQNAAREFEARWRAVPPEDRNALYPRQLEAMKNGGASEGAARRN